MTRKGDILARLVRAVQLLGDLSDEFIFVGGSVVPVLVTDEAAPDARPTVDVDVVVQVFTRSEYHNIEKRLAKVGFHLDMLENVLCRFKNADVTLDVMPMDEEILKFGNRWYKQAVSNPIVYPLLNERAIKVINAPLFLCTKFDAYRNRGHRDEKDLEDIIAVVDGRRMLLDEIRGCAKDSRKYISDCTKDLLDNNLAS
jgi:predicted nucleotidyltransferase